MDFDEARNSIFDMIVDLFGNQYKIEFPNKLIDETPSGSESWMRVTLNHDSFGQETISNGAGNRRFARTGSFIVQIFVPINDGLTVSDPICKLLMDRFEGGMDVSKTIWFKNVHIREIGNRDSHYQINFIAQFNYSYLK